MLTGDMPLFRENPSNLLRDMGARNNDKYTLIFACPIIVTILVTMGIIVICCNNTFHLYLCRNTYRYLNWTYFEVVAMQFMHKRISIICYLNCKNIFSNDNTVQWYAYNIQHYK